MAQWSFSLGSAGTGYLDVSQTNNTSSQVTVRIRVWAVKSGSWYSSSGGSWNANVGGVTGSGAFNYGSGSVTVNLWDTTRTYNKDANGNINIGCYAYINGDNSPGVGAGNSGNRTFTPARIGLAPEGRNKSVDTITDVSARFGAIHTNHGRGTSSANRVYFRINNTGSYSQTADNQSTGWKYRTQALLPNTMYGYFSRHWNNNGDTADTGVSTFVTLANSLETSKEVLATTVDFALSTIQGYRTTTTKVQYRKTGDAAWLDSAGVAGASPAVTVSGLLPNTEYEYRLAVTTTDGTWTGTTQTLTTLPAGKIVNPDGSVQNAIPRLVDTDGTVTMVNINLIDPSA